jgi:hypothetical protein
MYHEFMDHLIAPSGIDRKGIYGVEVRPTGHARLRRLHTGRERDAME